MSDNGLPYHNLYINGQWRAPRNEQYDQTVDPATGEALAYVAKANAEDTRDAILAARQAFDEGPWPQMSPGERSRLMHKLVDALEARQDELGDVEMRNGGCTWRKAFLVDMLSAIVHFRHFAKLADFEPLEPVPQITFPALAYNFVRREPIGVCGQIIPWNFPLLMAVWKIAPALAAGNCLVLKPASYTPLSALKMFEIINDTGLLPPGVINLVTGPGNVVGSELCLSPLVDKVALTGSTETGREVMKMAASTIKKVTLELGGKSPCIVLEDANLDVAAHRIAWGKWSNAGQTCTAPDYVLVHENVEDALIEKLRLVIREFYGDQPKSSKDYPRIVNERHVDRLAALIEDRNQVALGGDFDRVERPLHAAGFHFKHNP